MFQDAFGSIDNQTFYFDLVSLAESKGGCNYQILDASHDWDPVGLNVEGFCVSPSVRNAKPLSLLQDCADLYNQTLIGGMAGCFDLYNGEYINDVLREYRSNLDLSWYRRYGLFLGVEENKVLIPHSVLKISVAVSFLSWVNGNYAHWLFEQLPRLYWVRKKCPDDVVILVEKGLPASIMASLEMLWPRGQIVEVYKGQRVDVEHLIYFPVTMDIWEPYNGYVFNGSDYHIYPPALRWLSAEVKKICSVEECIFENSVYLYRPVSGNGRAVINQEELVSELSKNGVVTVNSAELGFTEQVRYFANSTLVVSASGAALANMLWMPSGSTLVVFVQNIEQGVYWFFHSVAAALGIRLIYHPAQGLEGSNPVPYHLDLNLDIPFFIKWLEGQGLLPRSGIRRIESSAMDYSGDAGMPNLLVSSELGCASLDGVRLPLVSVCIAAYNHELYVGEAIESVLAQDYPNVEILLGDDASKDSTAELIKEYASRYPDKIRAVFLARNVGPSRLSNKLFDMARGEYVALLGSDDRMLPNRVSRQVQFLMGSPKSVAVFSLVSEIDSEGRSVESGVGNFFKKPILNLPQQLLGGNFLNAPSVMMRRSVLLEVGAYDPLLLYVQDYDLWGRMILRGEIYRLPEVLTEYRVHGGNLSGLTASGAALSAHCETLEVMVRFVQQWPLELIFPDIGDVSVVRANALLELAAYLELMDRRLWVSPSLGCAKAYQLICDAARISPDKALIAKKCLERTLAEGFTASWKPFSWLNNTLPAWLACQEGILNLPPLAVRHTRSGIAAAPRIAVVLHLFYDDLWSEFLFYFRRLPAGTSLFITTVPEREVFVKSLVGKDCPQAKVYVFENRGRDVAPFISLAGLVDLGEFDWVLKVHSKKSSRAIKLGLSGEEWRKTLLAQLLPENTSDLFHQFETSPEVGMFGPSECLVPYSGQLDPNHQVVLKLADKLGFGEEDLNHQFVGGTMFWVRGEALRNINKFKLKQADFDDELGQLDCTLAHALERVFPLLAGVSGYVVRALGGNSNITQSVDSELRRWMDNRVLQEYQKPLVMQRLKAFDGGDKLVFIVVDRDAGAAKLTRTVQSIIESGKDLKLQVIVLTTLDNTPETTLSDRLHFETTAIDGLSHKLNELLEVLAFDWLMLLNAGEELIEAGATRLGLELLEAGGCRALYADELQKTDDGILGAIFRPAFNLDLLLSMPATMSRHWLYRREALLELGGFDSQYPDALEFDLQLRLIEQGGLSGLGHLAEPLLVAEPIRLRDVDDEQATLLRHLQVRGYEKAQLMLNLPGRYRINYGHVEQPLVSIIIPTKDQLPMLQRCVESLLEKTHYSNYELLIVDNNSETSDALAWFDAVEAMGDSKVRILRYPYPFNYSAINNMAASQARGEYLVLLNNDTAVISESWLDELLNHAQRPEVGIVGAKLLYPDGKIQHAGVLLGLRGPADHPFIGEPMDAPGYLQRLQVDQNYSAVTAACLMIRASIYAQVGGLDEEQFKVSYNDVDLCLKVQELGFLTVWTPHAVLMHEGSVSQKSVDKTAQQVKRKRFLDEQDAMYAKWLPQLAADPAYNRNLSLSGPGFELEPDAGLCWRPLDSWRPLPVVLAHPADPWGCGNYRIIKPFEALRDSSLIDGMLSPGLLQVVDLQRFDPDVIVLQRQIGDERLEAMRRIKAFSRAFKVYELDDYLPNLPLKNMHRSQMPKDTVRSLRQGLSYVDRFVVSTQPLAEAFAGFHHDIRVVENRLSLDWWSGLQSLRRTSKKPRVGWAGGSSHTGDLEMISDVVRELADEVDWVFFGMCPEKIRPFVKEIHPGVDIELYPSALAGLNLDLAVAPVENNFFNECKSNLRLLEYGACGFPVICSDVLCYEGALSVTRVKNRFKDWVEAIRMHISDLDATAKLGDELKVQVLHDWMLEGEALDAWRKVWLPD